MNLSPRQIAFRLGLWVFALGYLGWKLGWFGPRVEETPLTVEVVAPPAVGAELPGRPASGGPFDALVVVDAARAVVGTACGAEVALTFVLGPGGLERVRLDRPVDEAATRCLTDATAAQAWPASPEPFEVTLTTAP